MAGPINGRAKKSLGQHFLRDKNAIKMIAGATLGGTPHFIEIGPGRGAITKALLPQCESLVLVEKDDDLVEHWQHTEEDKILVLKADAASDPWIEKLPRHQSYGVVSNLPYNVGTVILRKLLQSHDRFSWMVLMFQSEVADRILYAGSRQGGALGILTQMVYGAQAIIKLSPGAFEPPPKVNSKVIRLTKLDHPLPANQIVQAWHLIKQFFFRRRALLDKAVSKATGQPREIVQDWFADLGIRSDARPDHLDSAQYRNLLEKHWKTRSDETV